jgi:hypothetical protein
MGKHALVTIYDAAVGFSTHANNRALQSNSSLALIQTVLTFSVINIYLEGKYCLNKPELPIALLRGPAGRVLRNA